MPKNVISLTQPGFNYEELKYRVYSANWGLLRTTKQPFADEYERLREAARTCHFSRDARKRLEWFLWCETTGEGNVRATCRHFGIAPKVFYFWRKRFAGHHLLGLEDRSHRPHRARRSTLTGEQIDRICMLRRQHPHYSKIKLAILYREQYGVAISSWKVQQVIERFQLYPNPKQAHNTAKKRRRAWKKKRITELTVKPYPGALFCIDTVVRHFEGTKRYILTAIDRHSRLAYARMYTTHTSRTAADFLHRLHRLVGGQLMHIQTDNGSEFHLHFEEAIQELHLQHWWSRARTPKDNAVCERFNRTLQEEFIGEGNACSDPMTFNRRLTEWLIEYDFHRPHAALGYRRPIEIASLPSKALPINPSHTIPCVGGASGRHWPTSRHCAGEGHPETIFPNPANCFPKGAQPCPPRQPNVKRQCRVTPSASGVPSTAASESPSGSIRSRQKTALGTIGLMWRSCLCGGQVQPPGEFHRRQGDRHALMNWPSYISGLKDRGAPNFGMSALRRRGISVAILPNLKTPSRIPHMTYGKLT
jgi:transposase InsO family protein